MKKLKINDIVWIASYPLMDYKVLAVIERDKNTQYEVECLKCKHAGGNCKVLIGDNDYGELEYKGMVNEEYEEYDNNNYKERFFYFNEGIYKRTKEEAIIHRLEDYIRKNNKGIEKAKRIIEYNEKDNEKLEEDIKNYRELILKKAK